MDDFFHYVSKGVIVVPIIIVILSLIFRFNQPKTNPEKYVPAIKISPTVNKLKINFSESLNCFYKEGGQEYRLSVEDKKATLEAKINGSSKKYDLTSYLPFLENIVNTTDVSELAKMAKQYTGREIDVETILKSCKKK